MYEIEKVKLALGGEDYAELYAEMRHKTQRIVSNISRGSLKAPEGKKITIGSGNGEEEKVDKVEVDLKTMDFTATNDAIILNQVVSWTFGEISQDVLDELPQRIHDTLLTKCNELYFKVPLATSGAVN